MPEMPFAAKFSTLLKISISNHSLYHDKRNLRGYGRKPLYLYAHFTDPYDQLKKMEADIMADMTVYVDSIVTEGSGDDKKQRQITEGILEYIQSKNMFFIKVSKSYLPMRRPARNRQSCL